VLAVRQEMAQALQRLKELADQIRFFQALPELVAAVAVVLPGKSAQAQTGYLVVLVVAVLDLVVRPRQQGVLEHLDKVILVATVALQLLTLQVAAVVLVQLDKLVQGRNRALVVMAWLLQLLALRLHAQVAVAARAVQTVWQPLLALGELAVAVMVETHKPAFLARQIRAVEAVAVGSKAQLDTAEVLEALA
jgi:hypothetical protein